MSCLRHPGGHKFQICIVLKNLPFFFLYPLIFQLTDNLLIIQFLLLRKFYSIQVIGTEKHRSR